MKQVNRGENGRHIIAGFFRKEVLFGQPFKIERSTALDRMMDGAFTCVVGGERQTPFSEDVVKVAEVMSGGPARFQQVGAVIVSRGHH